MTYIRTTIECYSCNDTIPVVDATAIHGRPYCEDCVDEIDEEGMSPCRECGGYFDPNDVRLHQGFLYCEDCFNDIQDNCFECGDQIFLEDTHDYQKLEGVCYCQECYDYLFTDCIECGEILERDNSNTTPGSSWGNSDHLCDECWEEQCCECSNCGELEWIDDCVMVQQAYGIRGARYECQTCRSRASAYWGPAEFQPTANTYDRVGSERCFGIELEYNHTQSANSDVPELEYFGRKGEHCGSEMYSSILSGDVGLDAAERLADFANDNDWENNNHCGYHLHLDMRDETFTTMRSLAYAYRKTYHIWKRFVSDWRANNCTYCHAPGYNADQIRELSPTQFERWAYNSHRFLFVNWTAYSDHSTVEVRLHSGTQDAREITNWVIIHARFVDWAVEQTLDQIDETFNGTVRHDFQALSQIWSDADLTAYYRDKANEYNHPVTGQNVPREAVTA